MADRLSHLVAVGLAPAHRRKSAIAAFEPGQRRAREHLDVAKARDPIDQIA